MHAAPCQPCDPEMTVTIWRADVMTPRSRTVHPLAAALGSALDQRRHRTVELHGEGGAVGDVDGAAALPTQPGGRGRARRGELVLVHARRHLERDDIARSDRGESGRGLRPTVEAQLERLL